MRQSAEKLDGRLYRTGNIIQTFEFQFYTKREES